MGNAVKYTEKGFVSFRIFFETIDDSAINLIIEVCDSGRGIREEEVKNLFNSYYQIDSGKRNDVEGVGLGLTISLSIVKAMDGDITVQSEFGKGSVFTIKLPQKIAKQDKLATIENPEKISSIIYERRTEYAQSIAYSISNLGVNYILAVSETDFIESLESQAFTYIFISYELYFKNKDTINKHLHETKIVILSEFGQVIPAGDWNVLSMPVHVLSVANLINGVSESFTYSRSTALTVRIIAPDASVLVVDDIRTNLKVTSGLLLPYKMKVDTCSGGLEAIEAVKENNYDIVFMDHRMPGVDGVEATQRIRAMSDSDPKYSVSALPIIALTANAVSGMKEMFLENGFNDFFSKPIDTVVLNTVLEKWLPKSKQRPAEDNGASIPQSDNAPLPETKIDVDGLDAAAGIRMSGGDERMYIETLTIFHEDGLDRIRKIKDCLETRDFSLYTIYVHAIKSAAANIGAAGLSEQAYKLETAGQNEDTGYIDANNDAFITQLRNMLDGIGAALTLRVSPADEDGGAYDVERFNTELSNLKVALDDLNVGEINRIVDSLVGMELPESAKSVVRSLSKHILMADFEEADQLIVSLLR